MSIDESPSDDAYAEDGRQNTRDRLLDAVIEIAGTQGQDKVTYRSVGAQAGMSHSLVRFYFGDRESAVRQAFERAARRDAAETRLLTDDIDTFGSHLVETLTEARPRQLLQYDYLLRAARTGKDLDLVAALYDHYIDQIRGTLANFNVDDPDDSLAALVFAALDGLTLQHSVYQSVERTENLLERLRDFLRLLQGRGSS